MMTDYGLLCGRKQQGAVLAVSLIFLVALTLLSVMALKTARIQESMASNSQQKVIAFEVAESAILSINSDLDTIVELITDYPLGQYNNPDPAYPVGVSSELSEDFDQQNAWGKNVDITSEVSVQYCGESALPVGSELTGDLSKVRLVALMFDVNGVAIIANSNPCRSNDCDGYYGYIDGNRCAQLFKVHD